MAFRRLILALAAALFVLAPQSAQAAAKWLRADTHNFIIYSSGGREQLEKFAMQVERFDAFLRLRFKVEPEPHPYRLTIYMLSSQNDVAALVNDKNRGVAGFYRPRRDGSIAVTNRESATSDFDLSANTILFHEYAHHMMFRHLNFPFPAWYVEGFAEYLSTITFDKEGRGSIGRPANHRAIGLFNADPLPVDTVLFGDNAKLKPDQRDHFYGRSWLLVHYLSESGRRKGQLASYLTAIGDGTAPKDAALAAFGELKLLDRELDKYLQGKLTYHRTNDPIAFDSTLKITALDEIDSQLVLLATRRKTGDDLQITRDQLATLAAQSVNRAPIWVELAQAELALYLSTRDQVSGGVPPAAEAAVDRALTLDPNLARANAFKAELAYHRLREANDDTPESWRKVRAYLVKANAADTEDPVPLFNWFESYQFQRREPSKVARDALAKAFELQPEVTEVRVAYILDLANQGKFEPALRLANLLAQDPHNPGYGQGIYKHVQTLRDVAAKEAAEAAANAAAPSAPAKAKPKS